MSASKDIKTGKWTCRFYYTNSRGERKQFFKRGFITKREALEFEAEQKKKLEFDTDMQFTELVDLYMEDFRTRSKETSINSRESILCYRIIPYFKNFKASEITPITIRNWQNELLTFNLSDSYLKLVSVALKAIFNHAVKFYNLKENPCNKAGSIGSLKTKEMNIWTVEEFKLFLPSVKTEEMRLAYNILFWTGIRIGELLALTVGDIDLEAKTISISKTFSRINKKDIITTPKTAKSNRVINIDDDLIELIKSYINKLYEPSDEYKLIHKGKLAFGKKLDRYSKKNEVTRIRTHDLRHSHASMLIDLGVNPVAISRRLGHEKVETTLNIYSHLYPNADEVIIDKINELNKKK